MNRKLVLLLAALALVLAYAVVPGFFSIDEPNYLMGVVALRHGQLTVPGIDGLPSSRELAYFDPVRGAPARRPLASQAPPLYSVLALPFSYLGLRWLFYLNVLAFVATAAMLFCYVKPLATRATTPWLAMLAFLLGSPTIEYALGLWPHMISVALCMAAGLLSARARRTADRWSLPIAGLAAGLACGIRYQNAAFVGCLAATLAIWAEQRIASTAQFVSGAAVPLIASSFMNRVRHGWWNPISKGSGYQDMASGKHHGSRLVEAAATFWAKVFDFSAHPDLPGKHFQLKALPGSGAHVLEGVVKKAWLQSSPWIIVSLLASLMSWRPAADADPRRAELRALSVLIGPMLLFFAAAGFRRTDGLSFNQRYFLELMPFAAAALALALERWKLERSALLGGVLLGAVLVCAVLMGSPSLTFRYVAILRVPLLLVGVLVLLLVLQRYRALLWLPLNLVLGAALGWALLIHLGEDVPASLRARYQAYAGTSALRPLIPDNAAVLTWGHPRNWASPLQLERDLLVLDSARDDGADALRLVNALLDEGRRVYLIANNYPRNLARKLATGHWIKKIQSGPLLLFEIGRSSL